MCTWVPVWIYAPFMYDYIHVCAWNCVSMSSSVHFCICTSFVHVQYFVCACVCDCSFVKNIHLCLWISCIYLFSCACMSVFACVSEYLYVYNVHELVCIDITLFTYIQISIDMWLCICICIWANVQLCICAFWNVWTCVHFLSVYIFICLLPLWMHFCIYVLTCLYIYLCVYSHVYGYLYPWKHVHYV